MPFIAARSAFLSRWYLRKTILNKLSVAVNLPKAPVEWFLNIKALPA